MQNITGTKKRLPVATFQLSPHQEFSTLCLTFYQIYSLNVQKFSQNPYFLFLEEAAHNGCGLTLHAISQQSPDILKSHAALAMPLAFLAMHEALPG